MLLADGKDAVSLREIARRCGVSPRAPYRHFPDRLDLLAAIAERGFVEFGAALQAARGRTVVQRLQSLAKAYIGFSSARPALMALMFGDDFANRKSRHPALDAAAIATFQQLRLEVAALDERHATEHAAIAWALVHGMAELLRTGQLSLVLPHSERLAQRAVTLFARGAVSKVIQVS